MRDNLDYKNRELATISFLTGLGNVNSQLASHMNVSMNTGMTSGQLMEFIEVFREKVNKEKATNTEKIAEQVIKNRK